MCWSVFASVTHNLNFYLLLLGYVCTIVYVEVQGHLCGVGSLSIEWVPGIDLRSSGF